MSINTYNPTDHPDRLIHEMSIDFGGTRNVSKTIHLVQYDTTLPVIAVKLLKGGLPYIVPNTINSIKVRWCCPNRKYIIKDILGLSADRKTAYFEIDKTMTNVYGACQPILELRIEEDNTPPQLAGSSSMLFMIDHNPVQHNEITETICYSAINNIKMVEYISSTVQNCPGLEDLITCMQEFLSNHQTN